MIAVGSMSGEIDEVDALYTIIVGIYNSEMKVHRICYNFA